MDILVYMLLLSLWLSSEDLEGLGWVDKLPTGPSTEVWLEGDSSKVINWISKWEVDRNSNSMRDVRDICRHFQGFKVSHIFRGENQPADWLASQGLIVGKQDQKADFPQELIDLVCDDACGCVYMRTR